MLKTILVICTLIGIIRAIATFGIFDDTDPCWRVCLLNLFAVTYCNKDKLTKFGFVLTILADLVLLPGAIFGSMLNFITDSVIYLINKFCIKQQ